MDQKSLHRPFWNLSFIIISSASGRYFTLSSGLKGKIGVCVRGDGGWGHFREVACHIFQPYLDYSIFLVPPVSLYCNEAAQQ